MRCIGVFFSTVILSLGVGQASAHKPLPRADWCSGSGEQIVVVGDFQFSGVELADFQACLADGSCPLRPDVISSLPSCRVNSLKDCGETNDDWSTSTKKAAQHCGHYQVPNNTGSDIGTIFFHVTSPAVYNSTFHHDGYSLQAGLIGQCLRCDAKRPRFSN